MFSVLTAMGFAVLLSSVGGFPRFLRLSLQSKLHHCGGYALVALFDFGLGGFPRFLRLSLQSKLHHCGGYALVALFDFGL